MTRAELGQRAEDLAATSLQARGATLIARNFRRRSGELDLVAREGAVLVIVEVRLRSSERFGGAAASIDHRKQSRIIRTASQLLQARRDLAALQVRFDGAVVYPQSAGPWRLEWIHHAFSA